MTRRTRVYRMHKVIKLMRQYDKSFDMARYFMSKAVFAGMLDFNKVTPKVVMASLRNPECGTFCCLAGFTYCVMPKNTVKFRPEGASSIELNAQSYLGLDNDICRDLFRPLEQVGSEGETISPLGVKDHNLANTEIEIGIKALKTAVKLQGKRDNAK